MTFSERLDGLLKENNMTRKDLVEKLGIGKNQPTYWEKKGIAPNQTTLHAIALYFGVTVDYLLGNDTRKEIAMTILDDPDLTLSGEEKWFVLKLRELDDEGLTMVKSTLIAETRRIAAKGKTESVG